MSEAINPFEQDLRNAFMNEIGRWIAEAERKAQEAAARGDERRRGWHQEHADELRVEPWPWERTEPRPWERWRPSE